MVSADSIIDDKNLIISDSKLRNGYSITWDSRLGCPRAGKMPALQQLDVIHPVQLEICSFLEAHHVSNAIVVLQLEPQP